MKMNLFVLAVFFTGLLFGNNPQPSFADGKGMVVVAKSLHFDAAETVCVAMVPCHSETTLTLPVVGRVAVMHPDLETQAGVCRRPPKKWECKG